MQGQGGMRNKGLSRTQGMCIATEGQGGTRG
jgi:hypothetical protein